MRKSEEGFMMRDSKDLKELWRELSEYFEKALKEAYDKGYSDGCNARWDDEGGR
jgi:hypothetical protein